VNVSGCRPLKRCGECGDEIQGFAIGDDSVRQIKRLSSRRSVLCAPGVVTCVIPWYGAT